MAAFIGIRWNDLSIGVYSLHSYHMQVKSLVYGSRFAKEAPVFLSFLYEMRTIASFFFIPTVFHSNNEI